MAKPKRTWIALEQCTPTLRYPANFSLPSFNDGPLGLQMPIQIRINFRGMKLIFSAAEVGVLIVLKDLG